VAKNPTKIKVLDYKGTPQTVAEMFRVADGESGQKSFKVRERAESVIKHVRPKDYLSEILALYYWTCGPQFRYTRDPVRVELVKEPTRILWEIDNNGITLIDCDEFATFSRAILGAIGNESRIVTVGFTPPGDRSPREDAFDDDIFRLISSPHPRLPGPFTHVFCQAMKPGGGGWVTVDPVAGPRTGRMHKRIKQCRIYKSEE
jgi:hypothetical protein